MTDSVLVTGASTGLGLATAVHLAQRGFEVFATMRQLESSAGLLEAAQKANTQLRLLALDVTDADSIQQTVRTIVEETGGIFGVVNNAGIGLRGYFEDLEDDEIRQVFDANLFGVMAVTRAVLPHMRAKRRGRIIIITSVAGKIASMGLSAYCSSKFAQEGFGESLSLELAPFGIHVSLVEPAIIKTERWSINRGTARNALNPDSPYHALFGAGERTADRLVESSPTKPIHVAERVYTALTVPRPRLRYVVGWRAGLVMSLRRYLPGELFEKLYFGMAVRHVVRASGIRQ